MSAGALAEENGGAALPAVGAQLQAAREGRGLSVDEVSQILKLGVRQVEALEHGDWAGLPGPTFIRGFVRNYAKLVLLDPAPLMAQLDAVLEKPQPRLALPETSPATLPGERSQGRDHAVMFVGVGLVVIALGAYFLWPADLSPLRNGMQSVLALISPAEVPPAPAAQPEPLLPPGATTQDVLNPQAVAPADTPATQPQEPVAGAAPVAGAPVLRLVFDRESWVEVRDGDGKVLLSQQGTVGSEQVVDGKGPFAVVIGNAAGVRLQLRGQPVDLVPHTRGDVARLILD